MPEENPTKDNRQLRNFTCLAMLGYAAWRALQGLQAVDPAVAQQAYGVAGIMLVSSIVLFAIWTLCLPKNPTTGEPQAVNRSEEKSDKSHRPPIESEAKRGRQ